MESSLGTDSQDSDDLVPPGLSASEYDKSKITMPKQNTIATPKSNQSPSSSILTTKGIQNAKKRLRAFSIQKKTPIATVSVPKPVSTGSATVLIGKLSSVKTTPKPEKELDAEKKPPKPPKPGAGRKSFQDSYSNLQKRTLAEIEDIKRKMELVDLGIPLGLICPSATSEQAMPTKAMPPIKSFLDPAKVDELIREAKKARAAGKEYKFDYQKLLPDYDNPFQRKKDDPAYIEKDKKEEEYQCSYRAERRDERTDRRKSDKYDKRSSNYDKPERKNDREKDKYRDDKEKHRDDKEKYRDDKEKYSDDKEKYREDKEKYREDKEKYREDKEKYKKGKEESNKVDGKIGRKETDVNLSEYLICDSWSLDNDDKSNSSPRVDKGKVSIRDKSKEPMEILKENFKKKTKSVDSPVNKPKMERLKPVIDAFKYDIDPNEEEDALELLDEDSSIEKYSKPESSKKSLYDSPIDLKLFEYDQDMSKDCVIDANDDNFLESVINEIKQENMSDDTSQDNRTGLVEYDSPKEDDDDFKMDTSQGSVTPELDDRMRDLQSSQQSHYSDGYRSVESGYKSTESGYKSERDYKPDDSRHSDNFRLSVEKELDDALERKMSRSTVDSLETWSFVLKICQPLLFRHDKNKCYKETHTSPKLWYTINPKRCNCVKDRSVVYEELEMCKMTLVDRLYGCDQISEAWSSSSRAWYPRVGCMAAAVPVPVSTDWETDEPPRSTTPQHQDVTLHREYQRFIESVWPEVAEPTEQPRSTTPDKSGRQDSRKKKKVEDVEKEAEEKKKAKKIKLSSEGWSQESDVEEEVEKTISKKLKPEKEKIRKRKHSPSLSDSESEEDSKKKKKIKKKHDIKKTKSKLVKKRHVSKKIKKKLKEKQKRRKKKNMSKIEKISDDSDKEDSEKKKQNKLKRKSQAKVKKAQKKRKMKPKSSSSSSSSSDSSDSSSDTESEVERKKIKKKELQLKRKKKEKKKKRDVSNDSTQSEDLFDVNVLNNIKTERLTDDEKHQQMNDFSPRRQKRKEREIINVKELQNDFVGNNIHIKQEKIDTVTEATNTAVVETIDKIEMKDEQKPCETLVEIKPKETENKEQLPAPPKEIKSPEISLLQESQIPLPDECENSVQTEHATVKKSKIIEQTNVHLPVETNIPLPADITIRSIPEPPPQEVQVKVTKEKVKHIENIATGKNMEIEKHMETGIHMEIEKHIETGKHMEKGKHMEIEKHIETGKHMELGKRVETEKHLEIGKHVEVQLQTMSYSYNDVNASHNELYGKGIEPDSDDKFVDGYDQENYEMYEQMAMAYQSDVAKQGVSNDQSGEVKRIETVVRYRRRGEIKCDWRAGDKPASSTEAPRPSRWGLKPGEVNIVLTGGPNVEPATVPAASTATEQYPIRSVLEPVYKIQSLANRHDTSNNSIDYDEAYQVTYGASDRLQYGDCFAESPPTAPPPSTLDERIDRALRETVLGHVAKETDDVEDDKDVPEKGILVTKSLAEVNRGAKRVSFADGYKPGQDSDVEEPPVNRKKKSRRYGCAWPCPASHPDHVPLWDALPPPPPPATPPPAPTVPAPGPTLALTVSRPPLLHTPAPPVPRMPMLRHPVHLQPDPNMTMRPFMPPEPPPGLITFQ
ncbi:unnamed protein product [Diatraea saccharalis]|uniref:Uncharacterized protein n=1 Tax=Diatraea saccharalis TaxID=40085 RepID=A0A9P0G491_9NEOP|nr:unnamed protein product [Diatraea saccharalis]